MVVLGVVFLVLVAVVALPLLLLLLRKPPPGPPKPPPGPPKAPPELRCGLFRCGLANPESWSGPPVLGVQAWEAIEASCRAELI